MTSIAQEFLDALISNAPKDSRVLGSQFLGDPNDDDFIGKWAVKPISKIDNMNERANVYFGVSSFYKDEVVGWKRRKAHFAAGLCLMIDDIGSGLGSKFPLSIIDALPPTALIETSPNNHQAVYIFDKGITDELKFNRLIDEFVNAQFLGKDTGMKGVTRVFRPPFGINGKSKYIKDGKKFEVTAKSWNHELRYSYEQICTAFGLNPSRLEVAKIQKFTHSSEIENRVEIFKQVMRDIKKFGMLSGKTNPKNDWIYITCPWVDEHTGRVDNGSAVALPSEENGWNGAFTCHHGNCTEKHWADVADYFLSHNEEIIEEANKRGLTYDQMG